MEGNARSGAILMTPLDERRFLFVTGKGGTGKTTVTAAMALALAERGRRVLIAMTEPKERISTLLGSPPIGEAIDRVAPNIWAVRIGPEAAMREYGEMILKSRVVYNAVFDNRYVRSFFAAVPGLHQWAVLGKAWFHSTEELPGGRPRFDVVLFDAPATGHGLEMLRVPKIIVEVVPPGILRRDAERAWEMFRDARQSGVVIVTLPEDMPANEAIELGDSVTGELGLPIARVVVNAVAESLFDTSERQRLFALEGLRAREPGDEGLAAAVRRAIQEEVQHKSFEKLRAAFDQPPLLVLPKLLSDVTRLEDVQKLARVCASQWV
jgi:anion-transporting  ArsA/GET3 family ATPase